MDPDDLQFYQACEADDQDKCQMRRLFEQSMEAERERMLAADDEEFEAAIKLANELCE